MQITWMLIKCQCGFGKKIAARSYTEKEKGEASDSFKRAGFNWGIGRELYTALLFWIKAENCDPKEYNGKFTCSDRFSVKHIKVENGKITQLAIFNEKTKVRLLFLWFT